MLDQTLTQGARDLFILVADECLRRRNIAERLPVPVKMGVDEYNLKIELPEPPVLPESTHRIDRILASLGLVMPYKLPDESPMDYIRSAFGLYSKYCRESRVFIGERTVVADLSQVHLFFRVKGEMHPASTRKEIFFKNNYPTFFELPPIEADVIVRKHLLLVEYRGFSSKGHSTYEKVALPVKLEIEEGSREVAVL